MAFDPRKVDVADLIAKSQWLRQTMFEMVVKQQAGHLPSSFSIAEVLVCLYYAGVARVTRGNPKAPDRDRILISKGHAAMSQYPILADLDFFPKEELERYTQLGGILGIYADYRIPGIEGISGSLGHGLGMGCGMALAARQDGRDNKVFVILGDGENYEGSIWESAMFAAHHQLDRLVAIVDRNQLCMLGRTEDLLRLGDLEAKWRSFGWEVASANGHSYTSLLGAFARIGQTGGKPLVIISNTTKGKGVSFMEGEAVWHNRMPSPEQTELARRELAVNCIVD
ncbi:putative transketolase N-terminal section(Transketolase, N-termina,20-275) [Magnetospirillum sp. XM-1]|uniref:transketolase n=1 Tax=Magnetospirillum sp. XM-1 TaxID=1663591 RepID=UPI00073E0C82|nr:transketolase [Magnetospirillum sp. XM-1]CUW38877.1 putative transketolase N-terminal section(Transketolase, N-termina,20-275) [Magnetospirillum sp. XM-1]